MRFTKILAATMAAMTIMSCSEQVEDFGANVQPGDAVLSFKVGTNGGTTYASAAEEAAVKSLVAYLKYTGFTADKRDTTLIKEISVANGDKKVATTLLDGTYKPGAATLFFVANMPAAKGITTEEGLSDLTDYKAIYTNKDGKLVLHDDGMTATRQLEITLKAGPVNVGTYLGGSVAAGATVPLKRLAARVYAESATVATDIAGYTVDFNGTKGEANAFSYVGAGATTLPQYTILGKDFDDQYPSGLGKKPAEAVGYVYPSSDLLTITVTSKSGEKKTVSFKPESNKNYKLKITPKNTGAEIDFSVEIGEYEESVDDDMDANFGDLKPEKIDGVTLPAGFEVVDGKLQITQSVGTATEGVLINFTDIFKNADSLVNGGEVSTLGQVPSNYIVSADGMFAVGDNDDSGLRFTALYNGGTDKTYPVKFQTFNRGDVSGEMTPHEIIVVVKGHNAYPANFTTKVNGLEFMSVALQSDLEQTIRLVEDINKLPGSKFSDKCINHVTAATLAGTEGVFTGQPYSGSSVASKVKTICPEGFRLPTNAEVLKFYAGTKLGESLTLKPSPDVNTYGNVTITYVAAPAPNPTKLPEYYKISDGTATLIFPLRSNFATSDLDPKTGRVYRSITYVQSFQPLNPSNEIVDTYVRCVKDFLTK